MCKHKECHNCPYNGTNSKECLNCECDELYSYKYRQYILDTYDAPAPDTSTSEPATDLPEDYEDKFRKALCDIFSLSYNELMMLKAIMNGKDLTEFGREMEKLSIKNKEFSRFRAFQTRANIIKKLGESFKNGLITSGQRKPLKSQSSKKKVTE